MLPVHQVGVGGAGDIGDVGRVHAHPVPGQTLPQRRAPALFPGLIDQVAEGRLTVVVVVRHGLELGQHVMGILKRPVGQEHHVVAVVVERLRLGRMADQGAVDAGLFLQAAVTVVPVGAELAHRETMLEGFTIGHAGVDHAGHPIHLER